MRATEVSQRRGNDRAAQTTRPRAVPGPTACCCLAAPDLARPPEVRPSGRRKHHCAIKLLRSIITPKTWTGTPDILQITPTPFHTGSRYRADLEAVAAPVPDASTLLLLTPQIPGQYVLTSCSLL